MKKILKIFQQASWQIIVKLLSTISGFIILGIVARTYGESGTGSFTLALTYLAFFYMLADFGLNAYVLSKGKGLERRVLGEEFKKLLGARVLWSVVLMVVAILLLPFLPFTPPDFKLAVILGSLMIFFFSLNSTAQFLFQAKLRYDLNILPIGGGVVIGTFIIMLLSTVSAPLYLLVLGYVAAWLFGAVFALLNVKKIIKSVSPTFDLDYTKRLLIGASPLAATLTLNTIYFRIDAFILSSYYPQSVVGVYNTAYQVFQAALVLPTFIMNAFYPMMLEALKVKVGDFFRQVKLAAFGLLIISLLTLIVTYLLSPLVIKVITGGGFEGSIESLRILTLGLPAYFLSSLLMWVMVAKGLYKRMVVIYAIGLIFNFGANLYFIPSHSYIGASWITGISEYLILAMQLVVIKRHIS